MGAGDGTEFCGVAHTSILQELPVSGGLVSWNAGTPVELLEGCSAADSTELRPTPGERRSECKLRPVLACPAFHFSDLMPISFFVILSIHATEFAPLRPSFQAKEGCKDALSILRRQTNRSAHDGLPCPPHLSPPAMPPLRLSLQYPREASTMEPCRAEVARPPPFAEGMGKSADAGSAGKVRS